MTANTPMLIPARAQEGIVQFAHSCYSLLVQHWNVKEQMRKIDLAYIRETDWTTEHRRAKLANTYGDTTKFQNITVPIVLPQVEAAVTYQASVFLTGNPIFGVVSNPQFEDEALQMNTIMEDQAVRGGWSRELMMFFRDIFKYNLGAVEVSWDSVVTAALETDLSFDPKIGKPKELVWEGNAIRRLDPYNLLFDTRCNPFDIPTKGEFAGYTTMMSRTALKEFINRLPDKLLDNVKAAFESGVGGANGGSAQAPFLYYIPQINPDAVLNRNIRASTDWMAWAGAAGVDSKIAYKNVYEVTTLYGRIIPSDFGLRVPSPNTPQVWKFILVNGQVLIYAERQTNAHNLIPILFGQANEDGLGYQTKSLATNVQPFQEVGSALVNSAIAARRRAISDRGIYDPSRIREADINNPNPAAKIPVRPAAYGKNIQEAYYPIPFRDEQSATAFQELAQISRFADMVTGQNQAQQGQFVKGNKTLHEYSDIMAHANGRNQTTSMMLEAQIFTPLKNILKLNILQYQGGTSLYSRSQEKTVNIDPVALRNAALEFKISDGLTPTDKLINADAFQTAMQVIGSSPAVSGSYNIGPMFSYLMKTQNADLKPFEKSGAQQKYEQAMAQWQSFAAQIAELAKSATMRIEGVTLQDLQGMVQKLIPPQPTPQQFGYDPNSGAAQNTIQSAQETGSTIMQQMQQAQQPQQAQPQ